MNTPTKLNDQQLLLMSAASQRHDRRVVLAEHLRHGAGDKLLAALKKKGLIEPVIDRDPEQENPIRRAEIAGLTDFRISDLGLARMGVDAGEANAEPVSRPKIRRRSKALYSKESLDELPEVKKGDGISAPQNASGECPPDTATAPATSQEVGRHDPKMIERTERDVAVQQSAPQSKVPEREDEGDDPSCRAPRPGTKLDRIITILSSEQGATIDELTGETGWLPHTARAALTGLRKRGFAVQLDRADKPPGSVYRIVGAPARNTAS